MTVNNPTAMRRCPLALFGQPWRALYLGSLLCLVMTWMGSSPLLAKSLESSATIAIEPEGQETFLAESPKFMVFINYSESHQLGFVPILEYRVNGAKKVFPDYKFYFLELGVGDELTVKNVSTQPVQFYYHSSAFWSLYGWVFCIVASVLGAVVMVYYYLLYRKLEFIYQSIFSLSSALFNLLHVTSFRWNFIAFFVMIMAYYNVVLGFEKPRRNALIMATTFAFVVIWSFSFSYLPYDVNLKISYLGRITGLCVILNSIYNLLHKRRVVVSSFALVQSLYGFVLIEFMRQHAFAFTLVQSIYIFLTIADCFRKSVINEKAASEAQQLLNKKNQELALSNKKLEDEAAVRMAMAAKAAHHLNNPIQAISGLDQDSLHESQSIQKRLEQIFPPPAEWDDEIKQVFHSFQASFSRIEGNSQQMKSSLQRAARVVNELRIVSGIHGFDARSISLHEIWNEILDEIRRDDVLQTGLIKVEEIPIDFRQSRIWIEPISFKNAIFYLIKEGVEASLQHSQITIAPQPYLSGHHELLLSIAVSSTHPLALKALGEWRELRICQHILGYFGGRIDLQITSQNLCFQVMLKDYVQDCELLASSA